MAIKTQIWGNLAADPEKRTVEVGEKKEARTVCTFTVMSNRLGKDTPSALRVEVWSGLAESCSKYLKKGSGVFVAGELQIDVYEKEGVKNTAVKLVDVSDVQFTDKAPKKE